MREQAEAIGPNIIIQEDTGRTWLYGDLEEFTSWSIGDRIKKGDLISKNKNIFASYRKNDYQIVRLRAMNTKSLDIKKRLQELIEGKD